MLLTVKLLKIHVDVECGHVEVECGRNLIRYHSQHNCLNSFRSFYNNRSSQDAMTHISVMCIMGAIKVHHSRSCITGVSGVVVVLFAGGPVCTSGE